MSNKRDEAFNFVGSLKMALPLDQNQSDKMFFFFWIGGGTVLLVNFDGKENFFSAFSSYHLTVPVCRVCRISDISCEITNHFSLNAD